jgi:hypothetical protein
VKDRGLKWDHQPCVDKMIEWDFHVCLWSIGKESGPDARSAMSAFGGKADIQSYGLLPSKLTFGPHSAGRKSLL